MSYSTKPLRRLVIDVCLNSLDERIKANGWTFLPIGPYPVPEGETCLPWIHYGIRCFDKADVCLFSIQYYLPGTVEGFNTEVWIGDTHVIMPSFSLLMHLINLL